MYQLRYWNLLKELKAQIGYLHNYASDDEWTDKALNIFMAIASSASIATWAIWKEHQLVWACIIALSQVVTAIKPFLPYQKRLKAISELNNQIQAIFLEAESIWYKVSEGLLTEQEIHQETVRLKGRIIAAERASLNGLVLPRKHKLKVAAEKAAGEYFTDNYLGV
ncbi:MULTISPECIES: hypothetical protein [unclassified Pseudoalteromonas]|uniref:hypothetical protein n=1 Tax=unclassified Pseudoalteromonas TaxID=194690 RepID=UPI0025B51C39|nr:MULTISPECIES: hypothetical protein [unclassified Pseudoalteromonas]MDN3379724.1 hypothetical protein [Pseudoalteromonas sp. APC 3893]MDN3388150.1 hypothetical protein [Pseudoalteromonas sp. APC 4017]